MEQRIPADPESRLQLQKDIANLTPDQLCVVVHEIEQHALKLSGNSGRIIESTTLIAFTILFNFLQATNLAGKPSFAAGS